MAGMFQYPNPPLYDGGRLPRRSEKPSAAAASETNRRDMLIRQTMERLGVSYEEAAEIVRQQLSTRQPAGPESLADGLDGAPQSDLTPEPVAGTQSVPGREQLQNQSAGANEGGMPEGFESLPFDQMPQAYQDYINSLPENSPERKAARKKRQDAADARMDDFQEGMDIATKAEMSREELARLRDGGNVWGPRPGAPLPQEVTRGPDHGTLSVKPSAANGWRSYAKPGLDYNPEEHDGTGMNDIEMQDWIYRDGPGSDLHRRYDPRGYEAWDRERSLRAMDRHIDNWNNQHHVEGVDSYWSEDGFLPSMPQQGGTRLVRDPATGEAIRVPVNQPMESAKLKRYTLTEDGRRASAGVSAKEAYETGRVGNIQLDAMDKAGIDRRLNGLASRIAAQTGRPSREVYAELKENGTVYQNPRTGRLGVRPSTDATRSVRDAQNKELADRRRRVASQAMLAGANPRKNAVNALDMLGNPGMARDQKDALRRGLGESPETATARIKAKADVKVAKATAAEKNSGLASQMELSRQQHEERMEALKADGKAAEERAKLALAEGRAREAAAERRHAAALNAEQNKLNVLLREIDARLKIATGENKEKADAAQAAEERLQRNQEVVYGETNPGEYAVMQGQMNSPAAQTYLKKLAYEADDDWFLSPLVGLGGFSSGSAEALNDSLKDLGKRAELMGINSPLSDPAYRKRIIDQYGYSSGWAGGRGGWTGTWLPSYPEDLQGVR